MDQEQGGPDPLDLARQAVERDRGRPSSYSAELGELITKLVEMGCSLRQIGQLAGMPSSRTISRWQRQRADFGQDLLDAKAIAADGMAADVVEEVRRCEADAGAAARVRALLDAVKWRTSVLSPRTHGPLLRVAGEQGPVQMVISTQAEAAAAGMPAEPTERAGDEEPGDLPVFDPGQIGA